MADTTVTAKFRADTSDLEAKLAALQKRMGETETKFAAVGAKMQSVGKVMTVGLTAPLVGLGIAAAKTAMDFESSMSKIVGLVGLSTQEVDGMRDSVLELSGQTAKAPQELADALFVVTSAGLRGNDALNALESAAKASTAGLGETADIARSVAGAMNAYGPATLDAARATDVIVATARAGNFETSQFAAAIGRVLPFAKQAGSSLEDMGGAVALLTRTNGDAAQSVTQVAALFRSFVVPTEEAKKALDEVGLSAADMRKAIAEQGLPAALTMLDQKLGGNREQLGRLLGSSEAASAAFQILDADAASIAGTFDVVNDSVGMTGDAFDAAADTAGFKMQQAMVSLKAALIDIGDVILPVLSTFTELLSGVLGQFGKLNPVVKTAAVVIGAVVAALGPMLWIGGKVITSVGLMSTAFATLRTRMATAVASMKVSLATLEMDIKMAMIKSRTQMGALGAAAGVMGKRVVLAFRSIGVAAKGLIASFGPIGIALTALTIGFEIFMNQSADAEAKVDSLKGTLDETTGAFTDLSAAMIAQDLAAGFPPELLEIFDQYGLGVDDMTAALLEGGDAVNEIGQRFNENIPAITRFYSTLGDPAPIVDLERRFGGAVKIVDSLRGEMESTEYANEQAAAAMKATGITASDTAGDFGELEGAVEDTRTQVEILNGMFSTFDKNVAMIRARDEANAYMRDIEENLAKTSRSLEGEGQAATKNRDAVLGAFEAKRKELTTWAEATGATAQEVSQRWFEMTQEVRRQLIDEGFTSRDLAKFLGEDGIDVASVRVERELKTAVGTMADNLGPFALRAFKGVGTELGTGLTQGIAASYTSVENEARLLINRAEQAARDASQTRSPSKKWEALGGDLVSGLLIGLKSKDEELSGAARDVAQNLLDAASTVVDGWDAELDRLSGIYDDALSEFNDFKNGITADIFGRLDLGAAVEQASETGGSVVDAFAQQAAGIGTFAQNLIDLTKTNLSQAAWQAVATMSAERGTELSNMMLGAQGQTIIDGINKIYGDVDHMASAVGLMAAQKWYGEGVAQAQANYEGFRDNYGPNGPARKALERLMDNLARALDRTSTITVRTVYEAAGIDGKRAAGGPVMANKAYLVGERGPEVLVMGGQSGTIVPNAALGTSSIPITGGGGGGSRVTNISINVNAGMGADGAEVGRQVVEAIRKYERRSGPVFVSAS